MVALAIQSLGKSFGSRTVLKNLTEALEAGDMLVVRGSNGSGKSTLLKVMAGLLAPTSGTVSHAVEGRPLKGDELFRAVGYVSPDLALYDLLTPLENLDLFAKFRGVPASANRLLLDRVGLGDRTHDRVHTLSTGLRQRLNIAFALQGEPKFFFLDEPTANLDERGRSLVHDAEQTVRNGGGIVVLATNNSDEGRGERELVLA